MMESKHDNAIQSINRALDILEVLATQMDGLGVTAIVSKTELSKSTAHRIAAKLVERCNIEHEAVSGGYRLGLKYIEIASYYINSLELQTEARPFLWELTSQLGLTAHFGTLDAHEVVYVEKHDVFPGIRLYSQIGFRQILYFGLLNIRSIRRNKKKTRGRRFFHTSMRLHDKTICAKGHILCRKNHRHLRVTRLRLGW
jgi:predicted transcriptional regulator